MTWIPALTAAATDPALRGAPLAVYVYLCTTLDPHEFRPVKVESIACAVEVKYATAGWAINRLAEKGYIVQGPWADRLRTYRLVWSVKRRAG